MSNTKLSSFSVLNRAEQIRTLQEEKFDLLVIGGGATGAGIALDAASRGLKTALVEKQDFAAGTSSKSTKLIHGGLRYLKQLDFGLVRETGTERAILHRLAPHLVLPEKMLIPLIKGGTFGKWSTSLGLWVYDVLASVPKDDRRKMLSKKKTIALEPLLDERKLKGSGFYAEYRTDDARLTIELIKTAATYEAIALNYCEVTDFIYENKMVKGVICRDELNLEEFEIKAKKIVSAGGPWVDQLRKKDGSLSHKRLHLTKGVHIVLPYEKLPLRHTLYFDVPDGRMIFAIPRGRVTYVGTTDTNYQGSLDRVVITKSDAQYLLNAIDNAIPTIQLREEDIISGWAGLRPLIHEEGKSPSELSRKDEIFVSPTGLISIAGGKLTGYRKMAQRIVNLVLKKIDKASKKSFSKCQTKKIPLTRDPFLNSKTVKIFIEKLKNPLLDLGLEEYHAWYLVTTYGKQIEQILNKMQEFKEDDPKFALARGELWFGVHHEMIASAEDFFIRRTGRLYFDIESIPLIRKTVMQDLKKYFNWEDSKLERENQKLDRLIYDATHFYTSETLN